LIGIAPPFRGSSPFGSSGNRPPPAPAGRSLRFCALPFFFSYPQDPSEVEGFFLAARAPPLPSLQRGRFFLFVPLEFPQIFHFSFFLFQWSLGFSRRFAGQIPLEIVLATTFFCDCLLLSALNDFPPPCFFCALMTLAVPPSFFSPDGPDAPLFFSVFKVFFFP